MEVIKNLHIYMDEKETPNGLKFLRSNFPDTDNLVLILGKQYLNDYSSITNLVQLKNSFRDYFKLRTYLNAANRIHIHGLFSFMLLLLLWLNPHYAQKSNWMIWGDDLYSLTRKKKNILGKIHLYIRKKAVTNIGSVTSNISGDKDLLENIIKKKYPYYRIRFMPSKLGTVWQFVDNQEENKAKTILIGNSATFSNHHMDVFKKIEKFKNENIRIIVPLSYGSEDYKEQVLSVGLKMFGDKFVPLTTFMERSSYFKLLGSVDVAVFANDRQQAIGNIIPLLYAGKKVYIRNDISSWGTLVDEYGLCLYSYETIDLINSVDELVSIDFDKKTQMRRCEEMTDLSAALEAYKKMLL